MNHKLLFFLFLVLFSCQEDYIPNTIEEDQQFVVEGYIEAGEGSNPTFVLLTRSIPFIGEIDAATLESLFIRNAQVEVSNGEKSINLSEICLEELPDDIRDIAAIALGFNPDSIALNICAYVDILNEMPGEIGGVYDLRVEVGGQELTARTSIPDFVPLSDFLWEDPPGEANDTLAQLNVTIEDPAGERNFYRYFTGINDQPVQPPFASVTNDVFFDGKKFQFPLSKAEPRGEEIDPDTFGLFPRGDSVTIKWANMDEAHFNFWNTLEFSANSAGPFSSYTRINSNVEGGLGVWGGYAVGYYRLYIPPK